MKLNYSQPFMCILLLVILNPIHAQHGRKVKYSSKPETKVIRNCEYQVLKGLAEIKEINQIKGASESALGYDEYEVKFNFIPMEPGHKLLTTLADQQFEFKLRSGYDRVPLGPKYLETYHVRKGQKFAMKFMQTTDNQCREKYTYESRGIPNDLFEAEDNLKEYKTELAAQKLGDAEAKYTGVPNDNTEPLVRPNKIEDPKEDPVVESTPNEGKINNSEEPTEEPEKPDEKNIKEDPAEPETFGENLTEEELREQMRKQMREEAGLGGEDKNNDTDVNVDSIRAAVLKQLEAEQKAQDELDSKNAIKNERKNKRAERKRARAEAKKQAEEARLNEEKTKLKKAEIQAELEKEIENEIAAKKARENAIREQVTKEVRRSSCQYKEKVMGTIKIVSIKEGIAAEESVFGYKEYIVKYTFKPKNYKQLSRKERKLWDQEYTFKLDPKGKSANPSATYVKRYQVFKGNTYEGFAQMLESGICQAVMIYAPDLPISASMVQQ